MKLKKVLTETRTLYHDHYLINRMPVMNRIAKQSKESDNDSKVVHKHDVEIVVDQMNEFIDPLQTNLKFVFHDELEEYYVTVIDPLTDEIIKEIPPKKMLDMYAAMADFMGILIDKKI